MNYYETLYIIHPALDGGRVKEMVLSINKTLESVGGGSPKSVDVWGKKKLAYEIDKQRYGTYVLVQFTSNGLGNTKFNMELEHDPNVLAYLTTRIDESRMHDQSMSLDDQISGTNPSSVKDSSDKNKADSKPDDKKESSSDAVAEEVNDSEVSTDNSEVSANTNEENNKETPSSEESSEQEEDASSEESSEQEEDASSEESSKQEEDASSEESDEISKEEE